MKVEIPANKTGKQLYSWLVENKATLISQKKYQIKEADAVCSSISLINAKGEAVKADAAAAQPDTNTIKVRVVVNTTRIMDSHGDVHIDNLWNKSLSETVLLYLLQEHQMTFVGIISDEVQASAKTMTWKSLGLAIDGSTQALVFDVTIDKARNPYMFEQYQKGYVKNHSVGMQYVKLYLCINDEDYAAEYDAWTKYIDKVVNKQDAEDQGYFWAVTEAKVIEGSAVPKGSNPITPTLEVNEDKSEPVSATLKPEPPTGTHETVKCFINPNLF